MVRYPSPRRWKLWQRALTPLSVSTSRMKQSVGALYFAAGSNTLECLDLTYETISWCSLFCFSLSLDTQPSLLRRRCRIRPNRSLQSEETQARRVLSIYIPIGLERVAVRETELAIENAGMRWLDLDNLLVEFWESHSIRVKIACTLRERLGVERTMRDWAEYLLPGLAERGLIGPPEYFYLQP